MGYERKRGKLMDLNALLRNFAVENFSELIGDMEILSSIKYVITLDSDTQLPRATARKMTATIAHPLNRAVYHETKGRTALGYGMLQPRIGIDLRNSNNSWYERMNGIGPEIDPYTFAAADVYQDLFNEGSFVGKGIYDVDIVMKVLHNRFPENRILSHDLLEGCYVRSGLLNDTKLFEPSVNYWAKGLKIQLVDYLDGKYLIISEIVLCLLLFCLLY
jgi:cyclic beta-1,2-glucan synthetase